MNIFLFCTNNPANTTYGIEEENIDSFARISMIFIGDIMGHDRQIDAAWNEETQSYDYNHCFQYVKPILSDFDLTVGNLEVTLPGKAPYAGYPQFKSPDALACALKEAGFNVMLTANNHSNDGYGKALINTIDVLRELDFYHTGTFKNMEERDSLYPLIIDENGFRIALLNYTYGTNGIPDEEPTFVNLINEELIVEDIECAKGHAPDLIIALMHWGDEYKLIENSYQQRIAGLLSKNGVDLIIGSHPHVLQPVKYISAGEEKDSVLTVFSLGNYISNQTKYNTDGGMMFEISYKKNVFTNEIVKESFNHHLVWRYRSPRTKETPNGQFFVIPVAEYEAGLLEDLEMSEADIASMNSFAKRMRKHMSENSISTEKFKKKDSIDIVHSQIETEKEYASDEVLFHVQIVATSKQKSDTIDVFEYKIIEKEENGMFKYMTTGTSKREEAEAMLIKLKEAGYNDAFIVSYLNSQRLE